MLDVERLACKNTRFHKDCEWVHAKMRYPDERYLLLKQRLMSEVKNTHIAYRIVHWKFGVLCTIKYGHDEHLFVQENNEVMHDFAVF
jgi:hypothetical protein